MHPVHPLLPRRPIGRAAIGHSGGWRPSPHRFRSSPASLRAATPSAVLLVPAAVLAVLVVRDGASAPTITALVHGAAAGAALTCVVAGGTHLVTRTIRHVRLHRRWANRRFLARHRAGATADPHTRQHTGSASVDIKAFTLTNLNDSSQIFAVGLSIVRDEDEEAVTYHRDLANDRIHFARFASADAACSRFSERVAPMRLVWVTGGEDEPSECADHAATPRACHDSRTYLSRSRSR